jgi:hypothetical protein
MRRICVDRLGLPVSFPMTAALAGVVLWRCWQYCILSCLLLRVHDFLAEPSCVLSNNSVCERVVGVFGEMHGKRSGSVARGRMGRLQGETLFETACSHGKINIDVCLGMSCYNTVISSTTSTFPTCDAPFIILGH